MAKTSIFAQGERYEICYTAEPFATDVLILHGWGANKELMQPLAQALKIAAKSLQTPQNRGDANCADGSAATATTATPQNRDGAHTATTDTAKSCESGEATAAVFKTSCSAQTMLRSTSCKGFGVAPQNCDATATTATPQNRDVFIGADNSASDFAKSLQTPQNRGDAHTATTDTAKSCESGEVTAAVFKTRCSAQTMLRSTSCKGFGVAPQNRDGANCADATTATDTAHTTTADTTAKSCESGRIYSLDLPGFGASSEPTRALSFVDYAAVVAAFCRAKKLRARFIIAHSFGCKVAAALLAELADFAPPARLILLGAAGILQPKPLLVRAKIFIAKSLRLRAFTRLFRAQDAAGLSPVMYESFKIAVNDDARASYRAAYLLAAKHDGAGVLDAAAPAAGEIAQAKTAAAPAAAEIAPFALVLAGRKDSATPLNTAQECAALLNARLVCFEGGHFFFLDKANFAPLCDELSRFLNFCEQNAAKNDFASAAFCAGSIKAPGASSGAHPKIAATNDEQKPNER